VRSTHGPNVLGQFGGFAGLFRFGGMRDPVLVASTDGVGSKVLLGLERRRLEVLGADLVNLSINDVLTAGARPLFFLDYVGLHALDHTLMQGLISGMAAACRDNGCALLGGETAQLPELYARGHADIVGTVVGAVERHALIDGSSVVPGDRVWGLPSTGLHTNGFTLARKLVAGLDLDGDPGELGTSLADALLAPHPSYYPAMEPLFGRVKAIAHITGGGIPANLPRVLPAGVSVELDWGAWRVPPIFTFLQHTGRLEFEDMLHAFNMGLGLIFVTDTSFDPRPLCTAAVEVGRATKPQNDRIVFRR
jgi:phosphoribosylformylglycinamidine cyclo-ligase